jgi:hypothetical protein
MGRGTRLLSTILRLHFCLFARRAVLDDYSILILSLRKSLQFRVWPYGNGDHDTISVIVFTGVWGSQSGTFMDVLLAVCL